MFDRDRILDPNFRTLRLAKENGDLVSLMVFI